MNKSIFLSNLEYWYLQTDGTYVFPNSAEGDLLKQAKREIEEHIRTKNEPRMCICVKAGFLRGECRNNGCQDS
jgi:hypothetical protein